MNGWASVRNFQGAELGSPLNIRHLWRSWVGVATWQEPEVSLGETHCHFRLAHSPGTLRAPPCLLLPPHTGFRQSRFCYNNIFSFQLQLIGPFSWDRF